MQVLSGDSAERMYVVECQLEKVLNESMVMINAPVSCGFFSPQRILMSSEDVVRNTACRSRPLLAVLPCFS